MSDLNAPERRTQPVPCNHCGTDVWLPLTGLCDPCAGAAYAEFRRLMDWPL